MGSVSLGGGPSPRRGGAIHAAREVAAMKLPCPAAQRRATPPRPTNALNREHKLGGDRTQATLHRCKTRLGRLGRSLLSLRDGHGVCQPPRGPKPTPRRCHPCPTRACRHRISPCTRSTAARHLSPTHECTEPRLPAPCIDATHQAAQRKSPALTRNPCGDARRIRLVFTTSRSFGIDFHA